MWRFIILFLFLCLPSISWGIDHSRHELDTSITVLPQAPGFTVLQGSDGSRTEIYQITPNSAAYFSQDRHGRETSGTI